MAGKNGGGAGAKVLSHLITACSLAGCQMPCWDLGAVEPVRLGVQGGRAGGAAGSTTPSLAELAVTNLTRDMIGVLTAHNAREGAPSDGLQCGVFDMGDGDDERTTAQRAPVQISRQMEDDMAVACQAVMRRHGMEFGHGRPGSAAGAAGEGGLGAQAMVTVWGPRSDGQVLYCCSPGVDPKKLKDGAFAEALQCTLRTSDEIGVSTDADGDEVQPWLLEHCAQDVQDALSKVGSAIRTIELAQKGGGAGGGRVLQRGRLL